MFSWSTSFLFWYQDSQTLSRSHISECDTPSQGQKFCYRCIQYTRVLRDSDCSLNPHTVEGLIRCQYNKWHWEITMTSGLICFISSVKTRKVYLVSAVCLVSWNKNNKWYKMFRVRTISLKPGKAWLYPAEAVSPFVHPSLSSFRYSMNILLNLGQALMGFPHSASRKESICQFRRWKRWGFDLWIRKIPWRKKWQPTPVFLAWKIPWTEEPGGLQSMGHKESDMTKHMHTGPDRHPRYVLIKKQFLDQGNSSLVNT